MKIRKSLIVAGFLAVAMLTGCKSSSDVDVTFQPSMTTIEPVNDYTFISDKSCLFVARDGKITSLEIESFEAEYYDANEFKTEYLEPAIQKYNAGAVKLVDMAATDGKISVKLEFATCADYVNFNKQNNKYFANWNTLQICKYSELTSAGFALPSEVKDSEGNVINSANIQGADKLTVCVVDLGTGYPNGFNGQLQLEGDVLYVAGGAEKNSANGVTLADSVGMQYIFFK